MTSLGMERSLPGAVPEIFTSVDSFSTSLREVAASQEPVASPSVKAAHLADVFSATKDLDSSCLISCAQSEHIARILKSGVELQEQLLMVQKQLFQAFTAPAPDQDVVIESCGKGLTLEVRRRDQLQHRTQTHWTKSPSASRDASKEEPTDAVPRDDPLEKQRESEISCLPACLGTPKSTGRKTVQKIRRTIQEMDTWIIDFVAEQCQASQDFLLNVEHTSLPPQMPTSIRRVLIFTGLCPCGQFETYWTLFLYQAYQRFITFSFGLCVLSEAVDAYFNASAGKFADLVLYDMIFLILFSYLMPNLRNAFAKEYAVGGTLLRLTHAIASRGYDWSRQARDLRRRLVGMTLSIGGIMGAAMLTILTDADMVMVAAGRVSNPTLSSCLITLRYLTYVVERVYMPLICYLTWWMISFTCRLHEHDMLCYSVAVRHVFESTDSVVDDLGALAGLELAITQRFQDANATWVRPVASCAITSVAFALLYINYFVAMEAPRAEVLVSAFIYAMVSIHIVWLSAGPLSRVKEKIESDLIQNLNSVTTLAAACPWIGEQLPHHLRNLGWGFRFGGSLIDNSKVTTTLAGISFGAVAAMAQQLTKL